MSQEIKISSNKSFGIVFFTVFLLIALYPLIKNGNVRLWSLTVSFIIMNLYPYNNGHLMVVPYRKVNSMIDLNQKELSEIIKLSQNSMDIITGDGGFDFSNDYNNQEKNAFRLIFTQVANF